MKKQNKWLDNYGKADNANESNVTLPEGFVGMGYDTKGRDYSPAWGGQFQTGGSIPGTPGFTYARTINPAPSEGKYAKKTLPSAQNGIQQDATRVNNNVSDKLWGIQRELDAQKLSDDSFREKYGMPLHQFKMRDAEYASAFQRQMEQRRMSDPNYAELNLPQTDVRSRIYQGNPNLGFIPGTSKGESRAAMEDMFLATTTATAPLLPINTAKIAKGAQQLGKYLTEETALRNAYKLNPYAFKPQEGMMYRGIGKEGMEDALQSGVFRPKNAANTKKEFVTESGEVFNFGKSFDKTYYSPDFEIADRYGKGYIGEVPNTSAVFNRRYANKDWSYHTNRQIPIQEGKLLQKDWLRGYKPIEVPKKQNGGEMKFYQEGLDWKPKSMQDGGQQRGGNTLDDDIISPLMKGVGSVIDYVGNKANDALQYVTDLQKMQLYSTYPVETAKAHAKINNWLFNNVRPVEYPGILTGVKNIGMGLLNMNAPAEKNSKGLYNIGDEAWQKSLGKTEQEMQSYYIIPSKHKPSDAEDPNATYYTLKKGVIDPQLLIEEARKRNLKENESVNMTSLAPFIREGFMPRDEFSQIDPIQKFKLSKGKDEKGEYVSIYDKYDFNGPLNSLITPYEWYDRFYINKQSKLQSSKPSKKKEGGVIKDNKGYLNPDNWGKPVQINSNNITMEGVYEPLLGIDNTGDTKLMLPGENYKFKGKKVTEFPVAKLGINQLDAQPKKKLNQLLNFTNNPDKNWLDNLQ
jgi:hypothetical protein